MREFGTRGWIHPSAKAMHACTQLKLSQGFGNIAHATSAAAQPFAMLSSSPSYHASTRNPQPTLPPSAQCPSLARPHSSVGLWTRASVLHDASPHHRSIAIPITINPPRDHLSSAGLHPLALPVLLIRDATTENKAFTIVRCAHTAYKPTLIKGQPLPDITGVDQSRPRGTVRCATA